MGKSLRNKSKLKFRTIKRATGVFGKADRDRVNRLAQKLGTAGTEAVVAARNETERQKNGTSSSSTEDKELKETDTMEVEKESDAEVDEMEVETKKISTSGWKGSRNDAYKKKQAKLKHKKSSLVFSRKRK